MKEVFRKELDLIQDSKTKQFVEKMLDEAPQSYFIREASSTNKYHPPSSRGYQGLVRHVKRCVYIAEQLLRNDIYIKLREYKDIIIGALLLHDAKKYGDNNAKWSLKNHAELAAYWIADHLGEEDDKTIARLVLTHMGQWGSTPPATHLEKFVHLCDYIASLKELEAEPEDMPVKEMNTDAKSITNQQEFEQLHLPLTESGKEENVEVIDRDSSDFLTDIMS